MEKLPPSEIHTPELGVYEHYKSTSENPMRYHVYGTGRALETGEQLVVYRSVCDSTDNGEARSDTPTAIAVDTVVALHTETGESLLVQMVQGIPEGEATPYARPVDMFMGSIEINGGLVPRFRYVGPKH